MSAGVSPLAVTRRRPRYLALALASAQQAIAYRVNTISGIIANFFWIAILYYLWRAAFAQRGTIAGFDWQEMRTYILLAYGINALIGFPSASRMMAGIRSGDVVVDLIRPLNYLRSQLAQTAGTAALEALTSAVIVGLLGFFAVHAAPPVSPLAAMLFLVSLVMGFLTKFLVDFGVSLLCFWTTNALGLNWTQGAIVSLFSGTLVPLALLPDWLRALANVLPFRGIVATPVGIYLGQYTGGRMLALLVLQAAWLVALWIVADRAWPRAFRAVEIQGG